MCLKWKVAMDKPQVKIFPNIAAMSLAAAELFSELVNEASRRQHSVHVALSGGSTPATLFQLLAQPPYKESIPWDKVHFYWADERCVPPEDAESNYGQAWQSLLSKVPISQLNIHRVLGELEPKTAAQDYVIQLKQNATGALAWPVLDCVLLGMGADGHTASLFPGQVNPAESTSPVMAVTADYMGRPANRVTLTPLVFNSARHVLFLVSGENKARALSEVLYGAPDPLHFPAQRIRPVNGDVVWIIDKAAASLLQS
jgi:6-phosphogluconolactonase